MRPDFARPREGLLRHQLQGAVLRYSSALNGTAAQRALVDSEKDKIGARWPSCGLRAAANPRKLCSLRARSRRRTEPPEKMSPSRIAPVQNSTDGRDDEKSMPAEPLHRAMLGTPAVAANAKSPPAVKTVVIAGGCLPSRPDAAKRRSRSAHLALLIAEPNQRMRSGRS